jgi:hypothetical protein
MKEALYLRRETLISLLANDRSIEELRVALAEFDWDCSEPLATLSREHLLNVLGTFLAGSFTAKEVELWAELVEGRDDIDCADSRIWDAIFVLANPVINGVLDGQLAKQIVSRISDWPTT